MMRNTLRSKLILFTVLPVIAVYLVLFWLGVSYVREYLASDAQKWLEEHVRHQASRLALAFSQAPTLAQGLGDLVLTDPSLSQSLMYAHLIDGLRRTPIAHTAAVAYGNPRRSAMMRRGEPAGSELPPDAREEAHPRGWHRVGDDLRFNRPIHRNGRKIGDSWVDLALADVYAEIERQRSPAAILFLAADDGTLLQPPRGASDTFDAFATQLPADFPAGRVHAVRPRPTGAEYWLISAALPGLPWHIVAATPTRTAMEPARHQASLVAMVLSLSLLAIVLIIGTVARRITRPLEDLDASLHKIARGDFQVTPQLASNDELGRLAKAVQRMARHLADRENQVHRAQQILEQRVAERTAALQQSNIRLIGQIEETRQTEEALRLANRQAQQANRAKSEFLSNMSHELRTPLHGVLGYAQLLRRDTFTSAQQRESLEAIERCGQHLLTLINDILDLTRIEAGQMRLDMQPTDLGQLLEDVRTIVALRAESKGLALKLVPSPDLPASILTDPVKLKQILLNLLGNAVKFTAKGEISLHATAEHGNWLRFEVRDTGVGIPADKVEAIFEAFNQVGEGQTVDGTGLGLAINRRLISLLGGEALSVDSVPGGGSRFRFRIPAQPVSTTGPARPETPLCTANQPVRLVPGGSCSAMVVDALAQNRELVASMLRFAQCEVETAGDCDIAAARLRDQAFDILVVDVRLPGPAARASVETLRQAATHRRPKLIAISTNAFDGAEQMALAAGFDRFLAKPFREEQLYAAIEQLLDIRFAPAPGRDAEPASAPPPRWPDDLARDTAQRIFAAIDLGDVASLFQLAEELDTDPSAPGADVEQMALMARLFDFEGLRKLAERLHRDGRHPGPGA